MAVLLVIKCERGCGIQQCIVPNTELKLRDACIIHSKKGQFFGHLIKEPILVEDAYKAKGCSRLLRRATPGDIAQNQENRQLEEKALQLCTRKIQQQQLSMKLIDVEYMFDRSKATFYFTADGRIDFRELVKDLAYEFRMRIEMKQIGVRDEAKLLGGHGCCGLSLCCATFLENFEPVSIRMAKVQNLTLDPNKISGVCGRLMCCLAYEHSTYEKQRKKFPKVGQKVMLNEEIGKIKKIDILEESARVEFPDGRVIDVNAQDLVGKTVGANQKAGVDPK